MKIAPRFALMVLAACIGLDAFLVAMAIRAVWRNVVEYRKLFGPRAR